jgi:ArsR family transcriptional regulator, arsenate/arsenite/antimonite-responsive transcriptional repressor
VRLRIRSRRRDRLLPLGKPKVKLVEIYQCLCDPTRLRILHLLTQTPLCVCHFQEVLGEPQVKISKHLAYLRSRGLVETKRSGNWMIYSLPLKPSAELETNLQCLQDCASSDPTFGRDLKRLAKLQSSCCEPAGIFAK